MSFVFFRAFIVIFVMMMLDLELLLRLVRSIHTTVAAP